MRLHHKRYYTPDLSRSVFRLGGALIPAGIVFFIAPYVGGIILFFLVVKALSSKRQPTEQYERAVSQKKLVEVKNMKGWK